MIVRMLSALCAGFLLVAATTGERTEDLLDAGKHQEAFELVEDAAANGDTEAVTYLAWFYDQGEVVERDADEAARLYLRAAEAGDAYSQWRLGVMIDTGEIGSDAIEDGSLEHAFSLFEMAAAQDFSNAHVSLGVMHSTGRGTAQDFGAALESFVNAARAGNIHAFNEIGVMLMLGEGTEADPQEGLAWFIVAATYGDEVAAGYLANGFRQLDVDVPTAAERAEEIVAEFSLPKD